MRLTIHNMTLVKMSSQHMNAIVDAFGNDIVGRQFC